MIPTGRLPVFLLLLLLLCIVAPSDALECLLRTNFHSIQPEFTREKALEGLRKVFPTVQRFTEMTSNPVISVELSTLIKKIEAFFVGKDVFRQECNELEKCCNKQSYKLDKTPWIDWRCSSVCRDSSSEIDGKYVVKVIKTCTESMCNQEEFNGTLKKITTAEKLRKITELFMEISDEIRENIISRGYLYSNATEVKIRDEDNDEYDNEPYDGEPEPEETDVKSSRNAFIEMVIAVWSSIFFF